MNKQLSKFLKNNLQSNTEQFSLRIPKDLKRLLGKKAKTERLQLPDYARAVLANAVLPEILDSELRETACEWITKQGKESIEIHFGEKIKKLKIITELAVDAINETERLREKFIDAEVEYLDRINGKLRGL